MKSIDSILLTDLYQLTMLQGYFEQNMHEEIAVFEFFVRDLPKERGFLMAAGLEQVLQYLENLKFEDEELDYLASCGRFNKAFIDYLAELRFSGDVYAMLEGTVFFTDEPILRITAPIAQAQLVESRIINLLHYQILVASKAARCVLAAPGKLLVDFGMRRAHGGEAALLAARASYLAGFNGTSTVLAEPKFGVPIYGTMAHSFVLAHDIEQDSFEHFAHARPNNVVLLIDTYDTEAAAQKVTELAPLLSKKGINIKAVRLDSGDIVEHANRVRKIFDESGLNNIKIFSSGNQDEYSLQYCYQNNVPINGFGVGTRMDTSADVPYLDCAYKLQEYGGKAKRKRSEGKANWPGRKQVYRTFTSDGIMHGDVVCLANEQHAGEAMINPAMVNGIRTQPPLSLPDIREYALQQLEHLPQALKDLKNFSYDVEISVALQQLTAELDCERH